MLAIVTGAIGVGKTTVCQRLLGIARAHGYTCGGVITYKTPDGGLLVEDVQTAERMALASAGTIYSGPRTERYFFNPAGIAFGNQAIEKGISSDILIVDEVGPLELTGLGFTSALTLVNRAMASNVVIVIRKELLDSFLPVFAVTPLVFETTSENRNGLPEQIASKFDKIDL